MTRNREFPDRWPASKSSKARQINGRQRKRSASAANPSFVRPASGAPPRRSPPLTPNPPDSQQLDEPGLPSPSPSNLGRERRERLLRSWQFWAVLIVASFSGVGLISVALLLKLPAVPNCPATFWPTASASMRLYCAQLAANKQTAQDLLQAIALVESLPEDHPLRPEINRNIEQWSLDILTIGEQKFQAGQLNEAIEIARRIPDRVAAHKLVEKQIDRWQTLWSQAEKIYDNAVEELKESNWNLAFREAVKLTTVGNKYWATVKYDKILDLIQIGREASAQLDKAYQLSKTGRIDDILEAIKEAQKISPDSFAHKEAQDLIKECGNKLLKIAQNRLDRGNWQGVLDIANKLPPVLKLSAEQTDLIDLANALSRAQSGSVTDFEEAIASAQKLSADRPMYDKAQALIDRWRREVDDVVRLDRARTFANSGIPADLKMAIAEAQQIPRGNPRYQEARKAIGGWTTQVETIEDQPYLERANQIAMFGGVPSLQEAIQEASRIAPGRALYREAQGKIGEWTSSIQRQQDQPFLDQARTLASTGNLPAAITAAQQIRSGRALYREAQADVRSWQMEIDGQRRLQEAYQTATSGTPEALAAAIGVARQVPSASKSRSDARAAVNRWSYQLLDMANGRAGYSLQEAISLAKMIPSGTEAYEAAQAQIQSWQRSLEPAPTLEVPSGTDAQ